MKKMTKYVIDNETREKLLKLLEFLQNHIMINYSFKGEQIKLSEIQTDLEQAEEVIEESNYDAKAEEFILIAKEMGLL